jgi:hypothetical protein
MMNFLQYAAQYDQVLVVCAILALMGLNAHYAVTTGRSIALTASVTTVALGLTALAIVVLLL